MDIKISNSSGLPIYEQIYNQIKDEIVKEKLKKDMPLPSIRSLAKDLKISVITTKRAYDELEKDGFIYTIPGKGTFIRGTDVDYLKEEYLTKVEKNLIEAKSLGKFAGASNRELLELFKLILEDD